LLVGRVTERDKCVQLKRERGKILLVGTVREREKELC